MRAVNLLPREVETTRTKRELLPVLAAVGCVAAVTVVAGLLGMSASSRADGLRADLQLTEAAIARLPVRVPQPVAPDVSGERGNRIAALQSALSTRVPVDRLLTELSYVVPDDVWLTGLTVTIPSEAAAQPSSPGDAATLSTVTIEGATFTQPSIARFLARLSALSSLDGARLTESARVEPQAGDTTKKAKVVITFTVTANLGQGLRS